MAEPFAPPSAPRRRPPETTGADFSRGGVRRHVWRSLLQHPLVVYPSALGLFGIAAVLLVGPRPWTLGAALGGLLFALLAFGAGLSLFRDALAARHVQRLAAGLEAQRQRRILQTQRRLESIGAEDGLAQFRRLSEKFRAFERLLAGKLFAGELARLRYRGMAEQVYLATLDNLDQVADALTGIGAIDEDFIRQRRARLEALAPDPRNAAERTALETRLGLLEAQRERVRTLMAQNEQAMTGIDLAAAAVAKLKSGAKHTPLDLDSALGELQRLAEGARRYEQH